jgi:hypothetical protein
MGIHRERKEGSTLAYSKLIKRIYIRLALIFTYCSCSCYTYSYSDGIVTISRLYPKKITSVHHNNIISIFIKFGKVL